MKLWQTGAIYENGKISAAAVANADGAKKNYRLFNFTEA